MTASIELAQIDGQHWIRIHIGGCELERRGPFSDADTAGAAAAQMAAVCRVLCTGGVHVGGAPAARRA